MSENELTDAQIVEALRCCEKEPGDCSECRSCPMRSYREEFGGKKCYDMLLVMAADRITGLMDTLEGYAKELEERMAALARECNGALERGADGVSGDSIFALNAIQAKLAELGRVAVVQAEPVGRAGWKVTGLMIEGRSIPLGEPDEIGKEEPDDA